MVSYTHVKFTRCELCEQKLKLHSKKTIGADWAEILHGHYKWCLVTICKLIKAIRKDFGKILIEMGIIMGTKTLNGHNF